MSIVEIPLRDLTRVLPFRADEEDVRYQLAGVYVEPTAEGCMLVATNGHVIAAMHSKDSRADQPRILKVSPDLAKAVGQKSDFGQGALSVDDATSRAVVKIAPAIESFVQPGNAFIDGKFPEWRKVIPSTGKLAEGLSAHFAIRYLSLACKPMINSSRDSDRFAHLSFWANGENPAEGPTVVRYSNCAELIVCIMPVRADTKETQWPSWMQGGTQP